MAAKQTNTLLGQRRLVLPRLRVPVSVRVERWHSGILSSQFLNPWESWVCIDPLVPLTPSAEYRRRGHFLYKSQ